MSWVKVVWSLAQCILSHCQNPARSEGIGKTKTTQELSTHAGLRSAHVLWGRCYEKQAMSLLDESLSISSELGMRPLMGRVLSRRDILKA